MGGLCSGKSGKHEHPKKDEKEKKDDVSLEEKNK
jgi:hypothetical protein